MNDTQRAFVRIRVRRRLRQTAIVLVSVVILLVFGITEHWLRSWVLRDHLLPWVSDARIEALSVLLSAGVFVSVWLRAEDRLRECDRRTVRELNALIYPPTSGEKPGGIGVPHPLYTAKPTTQRYTQG